MHHRLTSQTKSVASAAANWPPLRRFIAGEHRIGLVVAQRRWTAAPYEFLRFGIKQAWACLFGGIAVALMIGTLRFAADALTASFAPWHDRLFEAGGIVACSGVV